MEEIGSNKELFEKLSRLESLKGRINFDNGTILISFHDNFQLSIILNNYYKVYINDVFYYDIEGQDIFESIEEIANDKWIFVDKIDLLHKRKIVLISKNEFDKKEILKSKCINKIFSINELIYYNGIL